MVWSAVRPGSPPHSRPNSLGRKWLLGIELSGESNQNQSHEEIDTFYLQESVDVSPRSCQDKKAGLDDQKTWMMKMIQRIVKCFIVAVGVIVIMSDAHADQRINNPKLGGERLDWCFKWAASCGKPAADAFCRSIGFSRARAFQKAENVGVPTRIIGEPAKVCSAAACDSFQYIICASLQKTFGNPKIQGTRLDWCFSWAASCGKPAADAYCRSKGFGRAASFQKAENVGVPTRIISNPAQVCSNPNCDSFTRITCTN